MVDGTKPMRWGKLRSWLLIGSIVSFALCWFPWVQKGTPTMHYWINYGVGLITGWFYNAQVIATFSLVPSMCAYDEERNTLASNQMTGNKLGILVASTLVPLCMTSFLEPNFGRNAYVIIAIVCNAVMFATYMVHFKLSEGYEGNGMIISKAAKERLKLKDALAAGVNVVDLLASTPLWKGKNDVRRSIEQKGAYLNNLPVEAADMMVNTSHLASAGALVVRKGKKNYALVKVI